MKRGRVKNENSDKGMLLLPSRHYQDGRMRLVMVIQSSLIVNMWVSRNEPQCQVPSHD
jgi:hypothetical protein